jgi:hypothetical protein
MQNDTVADIPDADTWYGKIGLRSRFSALGHTVFYGEYMDSDGTNSNVGISDTLGGVAVAGNGTLDIDSMQLWGAGIVQEVDAAAMSVWVKYRHMSLDTTVNTAADPGLGTSVEDFQYVGVGGLINF